MLTAKEALARTEKVKNNFKEKAEYFFKQEQEHIEQLIIEAIEQGKTKVDIWYMPLELKSYDFESEVALNILIEYLGKQLNSRGYKQCISHNPFSGSMLITCDWGLL